MRFLPVAGHEQPEQPAAEPGAGPGEGAGPQPGELHPKGEQRAATRLSIRSGEGARASLCSKRAQGADCTAGDNAQGWIKDKKVFLSKMWSRRPIFVIEKWSNTPVLNNMLSLKVLNRQLQKHYKN
jgi:hypothetical protein